MTYYVAKSGKDQLLPYICINNQLQYQWFRRLAEVDPTSLTHTAEGSCTLEQWLKSLPKHRMTLLYSFTDTNNPEYFI